jgi:hypothetical protein
MALPVAALVGQQEHTGTAARSSPAQSDYGGSQLAAAVREDRLFPSSSAVCRLTHNGQA